MCVKYFPVHLFIERLLKDYSRPLILVQNITETSYGKSRREYDSYSGTLGKRQKRKQKNYIKITEASIEPNGI